MHQVSLVKFVRPQQLGTPQHFAPGLSLIAGRQGANLRLQLIAHGPLAAAIERELQHAARRIPEIMLDKK